MHIHLAPRECAILKSFNRYFLQPFLAKSEQEELRYIFLFNLRSRGRLDWLLFDFFYIFFIRIFFLCALEPINSAIYTRDSVKNVHLRLFLWQIAGQESGLQCTLCYNTRFVGRARILHRIRPLLATTTTITSTPTIANGSHHCHYRPFSLDLCVCRGEIKLFHYRTLLQLFPSVQTRCCFGAKLASSVSREKTRTTDTLRGFYTSFCLSRDQVTR